MSIGMVAICIIMLTLAFAMIVCDIFDDFDGDN